MKTSKMRQFIMFLVTGMLLTVFLLVCSLGTSPLYPHNYSYDSAFFRFIGLEILRGKTPYADIWDHKGPVLFFIQALGAVGGTQNKGNNVLFLLQLLSVFVFVFFMYKAYLILSKKGKQELIFFGMLVCALSVFSLTIESGNLTEEWCLPMMSCCFYLMTRFASKAAEKPAHPSGYSYTYGFCLGLISMIRVNNALPVCAGIIVIGFFLIFKRQWSSLFASILFGIFGLASVWLPIIAWFSYRGALQDMIYAAFTFNLNYAKVRSFIYYSGEPLVTRYLPAAVLVLILLMYWIRTKSLNLIDLITAAVLGMGIWMIWETNVYLHYFTVFIPVFFLVLIRCADRMHLPEFIILLLLCSWFGWQNIQRLPDLLSLHRQPQMFTAAEQIPEEERASVIAVNMPAELYLNYNLEPVSRFVTNQHVHFSIDPGMKTEFLETLLEKEPLWILADCRGETKIPEVQELIDNFYQYRFDQSGICYYRLKR